MTVSLRCSPGLSSSAETPLPLEDSDVLLVSSGAEEDSLPEPGGEVTSSVPESEEGGLLCSFLSLAPEACTLRSYSAQSERISSRRWRSWRSCSWSRKRSATALRCC